MEIEIPRNDKPEFIMDFEKFAKSVKKLMYSEEKVFIKGVFKSKKTGKVTSGDNFLAKKVWKSGEKLNAKLIYETYLEWFNYTLRPHEEEREFIKVKFGKEGEE